MAYLGLVGLGHRVVDNPDPQLGVFGVVAQLALSHLPWSSRVGASGG